MFQFPWFPPPALCVQAGVTLHDECWVSPFGHLRINAQSTAPRSFSQSLTSFIGSWRQGIHRWLFVAWKNKDARACSAVLKGRRTELTSHQEAEPYDYGAARPSGSEHGGSGAGSWPNARAVRGRGRADSHDGASRLPQNGREDHVSRCGDERRTDPTTLVATSTDTSVHQLGTGSNRAGRNA